ncbi:MAG: sigma-70 family RNA polymerase sigma factor [Deltaproteobacteria bacterium]|nr:sigma-70 family RNA polymerase sigma factor [Deltaproteobacteria bacterium]
MTRVIDVADDTVRNAAPREGASPALVSCDAASLYENHGRFVWASLQRLGVRDPDLEDVLQEVFVVVHQRLHTFDGSSKVTTWLFGICLRVVSGYRRRGYRRRELAVAEPPEPSAESHAAASPEDDLAAAQSRARLDILLDDMDLEKRAVFVMFEIDEMPCEEIASIVGVPLGTVYSRLHSARKQFQRALLRLQAREAHEGLR